MTPMVTTTPRSFVCQQWLYHIYTGVVVPHMYHICLRCVCKIWTLTGDPGPSSRNDEPDPKPSAYCSVSPGGKGMGNGNPPLEGARRIASLRLDRSIVSQPAPPTQQAPMIPPPLAPLPPQPPPFLISLGHAAFPASQPKTYSEGASAPPDLPFLGTGTYPGTGWRGMDAGLHAHT